MFIHSLFSVVLWEGSQDTSLRSEMCSCNLFFNPLTILLNLLFDERESHVRYADNPLLLCAKDETDSVDITCENIAEKIEFVSEER